MQVSLRRRTEARCLCRPSPAAGLLGEGTLLVLDNQIDQTTGTVKIKGIFPNDKNRLWPGQFVNVKLKLKTLENAIVVSSVADPARRERKLCLSRHA